MAKEKTSAVPSRYRYMGGVLDSLRALGGEADSIRVYDWLIEHEIAYPLDLATRQKDGGTRFRKEVRWARKELFDAGLIDAPDRGVWALTTEGADTHLTPDRARNLVSKRATERRRNKLTQSAIDFRDSSTQPAPTTDPGQAFGEPTTGPVPSDWSGQITRTTRIQTWTYLVRFGTRDVWKVGHTADVAGRLSDLNRHIPIEILGEAWSVIYVHAWEDAVAAYTAEQRILSALEPFRTTGERFCCSEQEVRLLWP